MSEHPHRSWDPFVSRSVPRLLALGLSPSDENVLTKWGGFLAALAVGEVKPTTDVQQSFVEVAHGHRRPEGIAELAWARYEAARIREQFDLVTESGKLKKEHLAAALDSLRDLGFRDTDDLFWRSIRRRVLKVEPRSCQMLVLPADANRVPWQDPNPGASLRNIDNDDLNHSSWTNYKGSVHDHYDG